MSDSKHEQDEYADYSFEDFDKASNANTEEVVRKVKPRRPRLTEKMKDELLSTFLPAFNLNNLNSNGSSEDRFRELHKASRL